MKIEVKGHSGCAVDIVREGTKLYIDKKTSSPGYFPRLIAQARKQQRAAGLFHTPSIVVPEILAVNQSSGMVSVKMEYIYSMNFVEYFEYAGFYQIMHFIDALKALLSEEISLSAMTRIKRDVLADKFIDVRSKCRNNPALCNEPEVSLLLEGLETIFLAGMNDFEIPAGTCHGDLTFSNILFSGNNYYLIDFRKAHRNYLRWILHSILPRFQRSDNLLRFCNRLSFLHRKRTFKGNFIRARYP